MYPRTIFRILLAFVLVAVLAGIGVFVYNAGVAQGIAAGGNLSAQGAAPAPYPYYGPFFWHWGFFPFGCIFPLFVLIFIFWAISGLFFRRHHGYGRWGRWYGRDPENPEVPPMVREWHRKMHQDQPDQMDQQG
jgi:hypothetical protein